MLVEPRQRPGDPFDVGRGRGRVLGGSQERHVGAVPPGHLGDRLAVGGDDDPLEDAALPRRLDRVREERDARQATRTFLSATRSEPARAPISATAFGISPPPGAPRALGVGTPSLSPARATEPLIASSSVGRPARASRAVDVVKSLGKASMIAHWSAGSSRDTLGRRHRARLVHRRAESRPPGLGAAELADVESPTPRWLRPAAARRATFSQSTARSLTPIDDARARQREAGRAQRSSVSTETTSEAAVILGAPGPRRTTTPGSSRPCLEPPDRARDDGRRRRLQQARAGANSLDLLEAVLERQHEGALERAGSDAIERRARGRGP